MFVVPTCTYVAEQVEERRQMKAEGRDRGREAEDKRTFFTSASFLTPS
jgi:hypothetical protein